MELIDTDPYLLPRLVNDEPVIYSEEEAVFYRQRDLLQKIKVVVGFDLVAQVDGALPQYSTMSRGNQLKFKNQCVKIFEICITSAVEEELLTHRFNEIVSSVLLESGVPIEKFAIMPNRTTR
jgi:hypothetical protein